MGAGSRTWLLEEQRVLNHLSTLSVLKHKWSILGNVSGQAFIKLPGLHQTGPSLLTTALSVLRTKMGVTISFYSWKYQGAGRLSQGNKVEAQSGWVIRAASPSAVCQVETLAV